LLTCPTFSLPEPVLIVKRNKKYKKIAAGYIPAAILNAKRVRFKRNTTNWLMSPLVASVY
jgi:hypothetical protein